MQHDRHINHGRSPRDQDALVYVRFRNGIVDGPCKVSAWRWKPWDWGESAWDVEEYWRAPA